MLRVNAVVEIGDRGEDLELTASLHQWLLQ